MSLASAQSLSDAPPFGNRLSTSPVWGQEDLVRRLCLALDIAKKTIGYLGEEGYSDEETPEDSFGRDKPLSEPRDASPCRLCGYAAHASQGAGG